jgi:sterol desaturase/sphingolipid hydroxylase (fatty acid hydroxylase superfamily)
LSPHLPDPVQYAIPGFIALILLELAVFRYTHRDEYELRDTTASLLMGFGSTAAGAVTAGAIIVASNWVYRFHFFDIGPVWWAFVILFFAEDLCYYWFHRWSHRSRIWWAAHVVHHSSQHYNLSTALRQTWTGGPVLTWVVWLPLSLVGFPLELILFQKGISLVYQFWIHTAALDRLPAPLEAVLNTPAHHRVHHARNPRYLDANYAGILIIWDRIFGSFIAEDLADPPIYGLSKNIGSFNPLRIAVHEWVAIAKDVRAAPGIEARLGYIFARPGWSHDGSRHTSEQMRAEWERLGRPVMAPGGGGQRVTPV